MGEFALGVGALIVNDKNEFLLGLRKNTSTFSGLWSRLGGTVEVGEKLEDALKREVREEIGVDIEITEFLEYFENIRKGRHGIYFGYLAKIVNGEPRNLEPDKCEELRWFHADEIPNNTAEYTLNSIKVYLERKREGKYG
mgnify:CR=1 FL=1